MVRCSALWGPYDGLDFLLPNPTPECFLVSQENGPLLHWNASTVFVEGWVRYTYGGVKHWASAEPIYLYVHSFDFDSRPIQPSPPSTASYA